MIICRYKYGNCAIDSQGENSSRVPPRIQFCLTIPGGDLIVPNMSRNSDFVSKRNKRLGNSAL